MSGTQAQGQAQPGPDVAAAILAAGGQADKLAQAEGVPAKALIDICGRPMIAWTAGAVREAGLGRVAAIVDSHLANSYVDALAGIEVIGVSGQHFTQTLAAAIQAAGDAPWLLLCSGDLPALTAEACRHFISEALATGADLVYSIVRDDVLAQKFPTGHRTKARLREGKFAGGNLWLAKTEALRQSRVFDLVEQAFSARKSPVKLARLFGTGTIIKLALGMPSLDELVAAGSRMLGCRAAVVISPYAEVCFDVDEPEHLAIIRQLLCEQAAEAP